MDELERNQSLCVVSHEEGCLSESIFDVYDVVFVAVVALLFSYHHSIISCVSSWTKSLISRRKASPEVLRLGTEVNRLKTELSQLSPISHFSAYFKTERLLNKTVEQYEAAVAEDRREHSPPVKVEFVVKTVSQAVGLVLLHWVAGIYVSHVPSCKRLAIFSLKELLLTSFLF
ncbi:unnamed protein product [Heligmosomoides polygyrus]|uniref:Transmembrane protein n=1 Tax=Heligmosomoides polygyrus TaxID=6339 RepID=A0A183FN25_HELPZ|nr:unnamed protein product [Heligmosomoides polygyrus]